MKFLTLFLVFFVTLPSQSQNSNLDLNDVSVLLPLPAVGQWSLLPHGKTMGHNGELLPVDYLKSIPRLIPQDNNQDMYEYLHVVGFRVDPCFIEGRLPMRCKSQIRMIWQPLRSVQNITSTFDASLHTFYEINNEDFKKLLGSLQELKKTKSTDSAFLPLGVNPFILKEGLTGEYYKELSQIILNYVGSQNLTRITFMQLFMNETAWMFGGFDIVNSQIIPIQIPRINTTSQIFSNSAIQRPFWFLGGIKPAPSEEENLNFLVEDSRAIYPQQDEEKIIAATKSAFKFENPDLHNPGTLDCVSCHVAQPAKTWAMRQYPWFKLDLIGQSEAYKSDRDVRNLSPMQVHTNIVRSFGYFMNRPFVAQRTINESAAVIKYLNENFK